MNIVGHQPSVRVNGVRPEHLPRFERLQAALKKAQTDDRREALLAEIRKLQEN